MCASYSRIPPVFPLPKAYITLQYLPDKKGDQSTQQPQNCQEPICSLKGPVLVDVDPAVLPDLRCLGTMRLSRLAPLPGFQKRKRQGEFSDYVVVAKQMTERKMPTMPAISSGHSSIIPPIIKKTLYRPSHLLISKWRLFSEKTSHGFFDL